MLIFLCSFYGVLFGDFEYDDSTWPITYVFNGVIGDPNTEKSASPSYGISQRTGLDQLEQYLSTPEDNLEDTVNDWEAAAINATNVDEGISLFSEE